MQVIYVDTLFALNTALDYLLLLCAAKLAGQPLNRLRFLLGALLGGVYSVAAVLPGLEGLANVPGVLAALAAMAKVAYGGGGKALQQTALFLFLCAAFAGGVMGLSGMGMGNARPGLRGIMLCAAALYAAACLVLDRIGQRTSASGELMGAVFCLEGRKSQVLALFDTGNTLRDPITGRPAVVVEWEVLAQLFPEDCRPDAGALADPVRWVQRLDRDDWKGRFRLLSYRSVGVEHGLLLAVRTDWVEVNGVRWDGILAALSPTPVSDRGRYRALVGEWKGEMA